MPLLSIQNLHKSYVAGIPVLTGINLDVTGEGFTAIIGPSGTGKSTLLRCINRLVEPTSGQIVFDGVNVVAQKGAALRGLRRQIGMVFQEYNLVERLSVMENVLSGRLGYVSAWSAWLRKYPQADIDYAFELLAAVGLESFASSGRTRCLGGSASAWALLGR
jgi:phosphonate transport system ATP-binding protein